MPEDVGSNRDFSADGARLRIFGAHVPKIRSQLQREKKQRANALIRARGRILSDLRQLISRYVSVSWAYTDVASRSGRETGRAYRSRMQRRVSRWMHKARALYIEREEKRSDGKKNLFVKKSCAHMENGRSYVLRTTRFSHLHLACCRSRGKQTQVFCISGGTSSEMKGKVILFFTFVFLPVLGLDRNFMRLSRTVTGQLR